MSDSFHPTVPADTLQLGKVKRFKIDNMAVLLLRLDDGIYAYTPVCPHANGDLTYGAIFDNTVECPLHGWVFNVKTGACVDSVGGGNLRTYPVEVRDGTVFVEIARPKWMDD